MKDYCGACRSIKIPDADGDCPDCCNRLVLRPLSIGTLCVKLLALATEIGEDKLVVIEGCDCAAYAGSVRGHDGDLPRDVWAVIGRIDQ